MKLNASLAVLGLAACLLAVWAHAQDSAPTSPTPAASGTSPAPAGEVGSKPGEGNAKPASVTSPAPAGEVGSKPGEGSAPPAPSKSSPQRFEPTEKVRPDFDVAFPVDI